MSYTLRVSVLDNCQLRCGYCLPDGPKNLLHRRNLLTNFQYQKIAKALAPLAIEKVRFTGGEPLLRQDLPAIIEAFSSLQVPMALTTNGLRFLAMKDGLLKSGLSAITFHLDTLKEERYRHLMGHGSVHSVLLAIESARSDLAVKINVVVQRGLNDDEMVDFLHLSRKISVEVRFIEQMNTGSAKDHVQKTFLSGQDILARLGHHTRILVLDRLYPSAPAERFWAPDMGVEFGLIASDTRPFCHHCNRLRLSADGRLRTCLYEPVGHDLGFSPNALPSDDVLLANITRVVKQKMSFHPALRKARTDFSMSQVGG